VYAYGADVVNVPFHLNAVKGADGRECFGSIYEGETLLHMAVTRKDLGT
jgi:hypothetical protein